ncbi:MAG: hypothetical protein ABEJ75_02185 [Candidatus Nanohaloarchaea archaeon]
MEIEDLPLSEDAIIISGGILTAVVGGLATQMGVISPRMIQLISVIVLFTAPVSIYSGKRVWGGEVAQNMQFVAVGLVAVIFKMLPDLLWAGRKMTLFGLTNSFWMGFFNFLGAVGFALVSYGFYRFWKLAKVKT